jgi:hypothetical protein
MRQPRHFAGTINNKQQQIKLECTTAARRATRINQICLLAPLLPGGRIRPTISRSLAQNPPEQSRFKICKGFAVHDGTKGANNNTAMRRVPFEERWPAAPKTIDISRVTQTLAPDAKL